MATERVLVLADTHLPKRARDLPEEVWRAVDAADVVVHAGDWVDLVTLERLLNPGSPTDRRRQSHCTYLTAAAEDGSLTDVTLHRLPRRTPTRGGRR